MVRPSVVSEVRSTQHAHTTIFISVDSAQIVFRNVEGVQRDADALRPTEKSIIVATREILFRSNDPQDLPGQTAMPTMLPIRILIENQPQAQGLR